LKRIISISFRKHEVDILKHLQKQEDVSRYIKSLIQKDMGKPDLLKQIELLLDQKFKNTPSPLKEIPKIEFKPKIDSNEDVDVKEIMKILNGL